MYTASSWRTITIIMDYIFFYNIVISCNFKAMVTILIDMIFGKNSFIALIVPFSEIILLIYKIYRLPKS